MRSARALCTPAFTLSLIAAALAGCDGDDTSGEPPVVVDPDAVVDGGVEPDMAPEADMAPAPDMAPVVDMAPAPDMAPDAGPPPGRFETVDLCVAGVLERTAATGAALAIVEGGELVHAAGIGHRNDPDETPVEPTTLFRFGSTLKGMNALAVFTEIEAGALTPDTRVAEVLPALAEHDDPRWQDVTVHHLLTHQGGFTDYIALQEPGDPDTVLGETVESAHFAQSAYFMVAPGTFYNYSNPNFMLAGRVLEVSTGAFFRDAMRERVFEPLGMQRAMFRPVDVIADGDYAWGSTAGAIPGTLRRVPADEYDSVWTRPAGLGWASVLDLAQYVQYVIDGGRLGDALDPEPWVPPVDAETWQIWRTAQVEAESFAVRSDYAHGLAINEGIRIGRTFHAAPTVGHGGNITGFTSVLLTVPSMNIGATIQANGDALNGPLEGCLASLLATSDALPPASEAPDRSPEPETFDDYLGEYVGGPNVGPMVITRADDGGLELSLPLVDEAGIPYDPALLPVARDMFALGIQGLQIPLSGIRPAPGEPVQYLRTRFFVGARAEPDAMPVEKRAVDVAALRRQLERGALLSEPAPISARPLR